MILKKYEESENIEKCNVLDIEETSRGGIHVLTVEDDKSMVDAGSLLQITPDGVRLSTSVNPALGFPLDDKGRLKVIE